MAWRIGPARDDAEEGDEFIDDDTGVDGAEDEGDDADEGEETNGDGGEGVGRRGEEECEGCPVRGEDCGGAEAD
ncbi:hypothetical protein ACHAPF_006154 [Botrytis cinerea]